MPPSVEAAWHEEQAGLSAGPAGPAGASGPCGRWQLTQATAACGPFFFCAWQVVHAFAGDRLVGCASWQSWQSACPAGAVFASSTWQLPQAGRGALGWWGWWHALQSLWPWPPAVTAAAVSRAWHVEQAGAVAAVKRWGTWQLLQAVVPSWKPRSVTAWVWQRLHVTGEGPRGNAVSGSTAATVVTTARPGVPGCGLWQPTQPLPSASGCSGWTERWQPMHADAGVPRTSWGWWQLMHLPCAAEAGPSIVTTLVWQLRQGRGPALAAP